jgi:hypothetical protein
LAENIFQVVDLSFVLVGKEDETSFLFLFIALHPFLRKPKGSEEWAAAIFCEKKGVGWGYG